MKTPLGMDVDVGPVHIVLDGDPASPSERGTAATPVFLAHVYCGRGRPSQLLLNTCSAVLAKGEVRGPQRQVARAEVQEWGWVPLPTSYGFGECYVSSVLIFTYTTFPSSRHS